MLESLSASDIVVVVWEAPHVQLQFGVAPATELQSDQTMTTIEVS
jgi:hypothetical protein